MRKRFEDIRRSDQIKEKINCGNRDSNPLLISLFFFAFFGLVKFKLRGYSIIGNTWKSTQACGNLFDPNAKIVMLKFTY